LASMLRLTMLDIGFLPELLLVELVNE